MSFFRFIFLVFSFFILPVLMRADLESGSFSKLVDGIYSTSFSWTVTKTATTKTLSIAPSNLDGYPQTITAAWMGAPFQVYPPYTFTPQNAPNGTLIRIFFTHQYVSDLATYTPDPWPYFDYFVNWEPNNKPFNVNIPANNTNSPIGYALYQGSNLIGSFTQPAQAAAVSSVVTVDINLGEPVLYQVSGPENLLSVVPDGVTNPPPVVDPPPVDPPPVDPPPVDPPPTSTPSPVPYPNPEPVPSRDGPVWTAPTTVANSADPTGDGLTNGVYREGVDKVVKALNDIEDKKLEKERLAKVASNDSVTASTASGASAGASLASKIPTTSGLSSVSITSASAPDFTVSLPSAFGGGTFDLNPFRSDRCGPVVDWLRGAFYWLTVVGFGYWASTRVSEWTRAASTLQQSKGNTVAGTGGQISAAIAAALVVVVISTFLVALVGYLAGDFSLASIIGKLGVNPTTGLGSALYMLDRCFPVAAILTALVARISWNLYASSIFASAIGVIRFINP
jgi:hypothetical protein